MHMVPNSSYPVPLPPVAFIRHLGKQNVGELLNIVAMAHPIVAHDVAVILKLLDGGNCVHLVRIAKTARRTSLLVSQDLVFPATVHRQHRKHWELFDCDLSLASP